MASRRRLIETAFDLYRQAARGGLDPEAVLRVVDPLLAANPNDYEAGFLRWSCLLELPDGRRKRMLRRRLGRTIVANVPKRPTGRQQLIARLVANDLASDLCEHSRSPSLLTEALRVTELALAFDAVFDDGSTPLLATRAEVLLALGRNAEAYDLVAAVLRTKPNYSYFQAYKQLPDYRERARARAAERKHRVAKAKQRFGLSRDDARMLDELMQRNLNRRLEPHDDIDEIRVRQYRKGSKELVTLPPSLRALLAYDAGLKLAPHLRFFGPLLERLDAKRIVEPASRDRVYGAPAGTWVDDQLPSLLPLPFQPGTNVLPCDRISMYFALADSRGEYPIVRFADPNPVLVVSAATLFDELRTNLPAMSTAMTSDAFWEARDVRARQAARRQRAFLKRERYE